MLKIRGEWLVLAAATLWGTTGTTQALAPPEATPLAIGALRMVGGAAGLVGLALLRGRLREIDGLPRSLILTGGVMMALYQICFFAGVNLTGVAIGTVVGIGSAPLTAGLLGWIFREGKPGARWFAATALGITGCTLLLLPGRDAGVEPFGVLLAIGAGAAYAAYTLCSRRLVVAHPADTITALIFFVGAVLLLPVLLLSELSWILTPRGLAVALHLGVVTVTIAYLFFARGLTSVTAATAVTLTLAEPLTAGLLGVVVVGERLTAVALVGIALLFAGLMLLTVHPARIARARGLLMPRKPSSNP